MIMMRALLATVLITCAAAATAGAPEVPADIKAPAGEHLVLKAHATGYQIYTCKAQGDGTSKWELKAPDADLHDKKGAVVGHHSAGPTWKYKDGSEVVGKASAHVDSPDVNSIPWLLISATGHSGAGVLAKVSSIQRINTQGGKPPAGSECTAARNGAESKRNYAADYYFYAAGK
jgi:Protein of unknown function (DUF3455)